jgi:hypothetical protein
MVRWLLIEGTERIRRKLRPGFASSTAKLAQSLYASAVVQISGHKKNILIAYTRIRDGKSLRSSVKNQKVNYFR